MSITTAPNVLSYLLLGDGNEVNSITQSVKVSGLLSLIPWLFCQAIFEVEDAYIDNSGLAQMRCNMSALHYPLVDMAFNATSHFKCFVKDKDRRYPQAQRHLSQHFERAMRTMRLFELKHSELISTALSQ